jgi:dihydrofolate reductase
MKQIVLVAALSENHAIGKDNQLLWHLPEDLKRFRAMTLGHTVVMGRKTFESIGKPLPKRKNVVLSRNTNWLHPEVLVYNDLEKAIAACAEETLMILGGAEIYSQSMPLADRLELTHVHSHFKGDAFFPAIDNNIWEAEHGERKTDAASGISYTFSKWLKKQP